MVSAFLPTALQARLDKLGMYSFVSTMAQYIGRETDAYTEGM